MSAVQRLIAALHTAGGSAPRQAAQWIELAQSDELLRAAVRTVFGKRLPTPQKLGQWLTEHIGQQSGEVTLRGIHSPRLKAWVYRVWTPQEREQYRAERDARLAEHEAKHAAYLQHFADKERLRLAKNRMSQELKNELRYGKVRGPSITIEAPGPACPVPVEYECTTRVGSDGRVIREPVIGRDGKPVEKRPAPEAAAKPAELPKPAPAALPPPGTRVPRICEGGHWRDMTAEEIARLPHRQDAGFRVLQIWHATGYGAPLGFDDPGGVVSQAIDKEYVGQAWRWSQDL